MAGKTQTIRVKRKMLGALVMLFGALMLGSYGARSGSLLFLVIAGLIALAALAALALSRVTLGPTELVQHAPLSPKTNVRIAKSAITGVHTAPWASVTQVVVDTTSGEVVLMGLSAYVKEQGVESAIRIAQWAGVPYDPRPYPDRGPQRRS